MICHGEMSCTRIPEYLPQTRSKLLIIASAPKTASFSNHNYKNTTFQQDLSRFNFRSYAHRPAPNPSNATPTLTRVRTKGTVLQTKLATSLDHG